MNYTDAYVDRAIHELTRGKSNVYGIMLRPNGELYVFGKMLHHKIVKLYLRCDIHFYDEQTFRNQLVLYDKKGDRPGGYILLDRDENCIYNTFDDGQRELCMIAFMEPNSLHPFGGERVQKDNSIPICMKVVLSNFGCAVAVVQNLGISRLWMLEGEKIKQSLSADSLKEGAAPWMIGFGKN